MFIIFHFSVFPLKWKIIFVIMIKSSWCFDEFKVLKYCKSDVLFIYFIDFAHMVLPIIPRLHVIEIYIDWRKDVRIFWFDFRSISSHLPSLVWCVMCVLPCTQFPGQTPTQPQPWHVSDRVVSNGCRGVSGCV